MKSRCLILLTAALIIRGSVPFANAEVVYRGLQNVAIPTGPTGFTGVYLNIDSGTTNSVEFTGWDINPFFGGVGVANGASFQPARVGTANDDPIIALGAGASVDGGLFFSTGEGGSENVLGTGSTQFGVGQEAYLGFRFTTDANAGPYFGWMRVIFTANTPGAVIKDWAWETGGTAISTGSVLQAPSVAGVSVVTLSGGLGQASTLGPLLDNAGSGNALSIEKTGAGTWTLSAPPNYSSLTINDGLTNLNVSLASGTINSNGGTLNVNASQTLAALNIGAGGVTVLAGSASALGEGDLLAASPAQAVPEPGRATLLLVGFVALLLSRKPRCIPA